MWFPRGQKEGIVNKSENRNSKEGISRKRNQAFLLWMREKKRRFQHEKRLPYADSRECIGSLYHQALILFVNSLIAFFRAASFAILDWILLTLAKTVV